MGANEEQVFYTAVLSAGRPQQGYLKALEMSFLIKRPQQKNQKHKKSLLEDVWTPLGQLMLDDKLLINVSRYTCLGLAAGLVCLHTKGGLVLRAG